MRELSKFSRCPEFVCDLNSLIYWKPFAAPTASATVCLFPLWLRFGQISFVPHRGARGENECGMGGRGFFHARLFSTLFDCGMTMTMVRKHETPHITNSNYYMYGSGFPTAPYSAPLLVLVLLFLAVQLSCCRRGKGPFLAGKLSNRLGTFMKASSLQTPISPHLILPSEGPRTHPYHCPSYFV